MSKLTDKQIEKLKKLGTNRTTGNGTIQIKLDNGAIINIGTNKNYWIQGKNKEEVKKQ